jgi:predicted secreted protein
MSSLSNFTGARFLRHVGNVLLISSLVACGGGGGGGSKSSVTPNPVNSSSSAVALSSSSSSVQSSSASSVAVAPTVDAGVAASVVTGKNFEFAGAATADEGKQLTSFLWEQVGNAPIRVEITDADQLAASFTAPYVSSDTAVNFRLTVTDSAGLTASDTVEITISSDPDAPVAGLRFPPAAGIYTSPVISVFGKAQVRDDAQLSKVTVVTSLGEVEVAVDNSGSWRVDDLPVPIGDNNFTISVRAEDSKGRIGIERSELTSLENASIGGGIAWGPRSASIAYEQGRNTVWVLFNGNSVGDTKIIPVNIKTGHRGASILKTPIPAATMIADRLGFSFFVVGSSSGQQAELNSVSKYFDSVDLLSGEKKGAGPDFDIASAGIVTSLGGDIYIANNSIDTNDFSGVMKVDEYTGARSVFLSPADHEIYNYLSFMGSASVMTNELIFVSNSSTNSTVFATNIRTRVIRAINEGSSGVGASAQFSVNGNYLYVVSGNSRLQKININTGAVETITSSLPETGALVKKQVAYNPDDKLIYVAISDKGIYVIDEVSGNIAALSTK